MASDLARAVRDRLAAGAALVAILVGVGAGVVWVAERSVKDAVTAAVNATVPGAIEAALNSREEATRAFIVDAVNEAVGRELQPLQDDVAALKLARARAAGNPAVAAAVFPSASWVSEFEKWAEANPDAGVSVVMGNWQRRAVGGAVSRVGGRQSRNGASMRPDPSHRRRALLSFRLRPTRG